VTVVVSDTSPLHYLILCHAEVILPKLFSQVVIPPAVFQELQHPHTPAIVRTWAETLPPWIRRQSPTTLDPTLDIDRGELEAICLAREIRADAILMDDKRGREVARRCGLQVTGTIGLLELAGTRQLIRFSDAIRQLQLTSARLDPELVQAALERDRVRRAREQPPSGRDPKP
jgi:predicted nucleic acid-binding protein